MRSCKVCKNTNGAKIAGQKIKRMQPGLSAGKAMIQDICGGKCSNLISGEFLKEFRGSVHELCITYTSRKISGQV